MTAQAQDAALPEGQEPPPPGWRAMAVVRWIIVALMAIAALSAVMHALPSHRSAEHAHETWTCPMHPQVVQDHPGQCPICNMNLVKVEPVRGDQSTSAGATQVPGLVPIELSPERVQLIGMKTAKATRESLGTAVDTVGVVTASERGLATVTTRYAGFVETLLASETGKKVQRGELLARVYSPQVHLAMQEYLTSRGVGAILGGDAGDLAGDARKRLELLGVPAAELDALDKSGKPSKTIGVYAPIAGFVLQKSAVQGASFQAGTDLFTIADLTTVWVIADVYEGELARVKVGQTATVVVPALDRSFAGAVKFIQPTLDVATRTGKVRIELANSAFDLKPGMYGNVSLAASASTAIVIPREAIVDTGELQYVFVEESAGRFTPRKVTLGSKTADRIEVRSGVAEGETVVTTGNFLVDSESRLRAAAVKP